MLRASDAPLHHLGPVADQNDGLFDPAFAHDAKLAMDQRQVADGQDGLGIKLAEHSHARAAAAGENRGAADGRVVHEPPCAAAEDEPAIGSKGRLPPGGSPYFRNRMASRTRSGSSRTAMAVV